MSNFDRAVKALNDVDEAIDHLADNEAYVTALEAAGLLAPELAQALAEETWEYGVEYKYLTNRGAEWRLGPGAGWHKTYRDAERAASASVQYRIVRRRVSPPEAING